MGMRLWYSPWCLDLGRDTKPHSKAHGNSSPKICPYLLHKFVYKGMEQSMKELQQGTRKGAEEIQM